jgi:hypothetical protein
VGYLKPILLTTSSKNVFGTVEKKEFTVFYDNLFDKNFLHYKNEKYETPIFHLCVGLSRPN